MTHDTPKPAPHSPELVELVRGLRLARRALAFQPHPLNADAAADKKAVLVKIDAILAARDAEQEPVDPLVAVIADFRSAPNKEMTPAEEAAYLRALLIRSGTLTFPGEPA